MSTRRGTALTLVALAPVLVVAALARPVEAASSTLPTPPTPTSQVLEPTQVQQPTQVTPTTQATPTTEVLQTTQAAPTPASGIAITRPQNGETVVNTGLQIVGTAPPAWLVSVSIIDTDLNRTEIEHQPNGRVDGSVTSDASGHWVFVPGVRITPGRFEVSASYLSDDNQTLDSPVMQFTVVNESGESSLPSSSVKWKVALAVLFGILAIGGTMYYRRSPRFDHFHNRHVARPRPPRPQRQWPEDEAPIPARAPTPTPSPYIDSTPLFLNTSDGQAYQREQARKLQGMEQEMKAIQRALVDSAEALERSNRAVVALHQQIHSQLAETTPEPEVVKPAAKRNGTKSLVIADGLSPEEEAVWSAPKRNGAKQLVIVDALRPEPKVVKPAPKRNGTKKLVVVDDFTPEPEVVKTAPKRNHAKRPVAIRSSVAHPEVVLGGAQGNGASQTVAADDR